MKRLKMVMVVASMTMMIMVAWSKAVRAGETTHHHHCHLWHRLLQEEESVRGRHELDAWFVAWH
jgi:hypothetical protein